MSVWDKIVRSLNIEEKLSSTLTKNKNKKFKGDDRVMKVEDITIRQNQNRYMLVNSLGYSIMLVDMPRDNQYFLDAKVLYMMAKALSLRWKQKQASKENKLAKFDYFGMFIIQTERNGYSIYLPSREQIAMVYFPLDGNYLDDDQCLKVLCRGLALRYGIKK